MKLIAINIDDLKLESLMNDFKIIYNEMKEQDITLVITSNKQYNKLYSIFSVYDNIYYVAENGALIMHNNEVIEKNTFSEMEVVLILEELLEYSDMIVCVSGVKGAYLQSKDRAYYDNFKQYYEKLELVDNFEELDDQVIKFVGYVNNADESSDKCDVMFVENQVIDEHLIAFSMEDVTSNTGIEAICRKMNISKDDITCYDGINALEEASELLKRNKIS